MTIQNESRRRRIVRLEPSRQSAVLPGAVLSEQGRGIRSPPHGTVASPRGSVALALLMFSRCHVMSKLLVLELASRDSQALCTWGGGGVSRSEKHPKYSHKAQALTARGRCYLPS